MTNSTVQGFILAKRKFGEGDLMVDVYTREQGRITIVAKGARKARAKLRAHLEPFTLVELRLVKGKGLDVLVGAQTQVINKFFSAGLDQKTAAFVMTEALQKTTAEAQPNPKIFDLYNNILMELETKTAPSLSLCFGLLHLLRAEGIEPELPTQIASKFYFDLEEGVISAKATSKSILLSPNMVKLWKLILNFDLATITRVTADSKLLSDSVVIVCRYIEYHFHVTLKSLRVFQDTN